MKANNMTYEEASELIKSLDPEYSVIYPRYADEKYDFQVFYNESLVAYVPFNKEQKIESDSNLLKFNEGYTLWMILAKLAITPLEKRGLIPVTLFYIHLFPGDKGYLNYNPVTNTIVLEKKHYVWQFVSKFVEDDYNRLQEDFSQYLPKFDKDDPRFEIVN
ncbi:hypothetical protein HWC08_gp028 [Lactobacillus phage 521B]|uniref:Uncharacterized protein n=1 Tax=Lactobacillus phage 521B TaxID=2510942 RepID=A0A4Y5FG25_9CAUD|nr:hypothetical protein HWC08_gp028 [Lactobacillus phage 521B]QBJ03378.1 hypothetical protein B521_0028 [Lactobacillus phage 521B]